jgi:hypothetical protein
MSNPDLIKKIKDGIKKSGFPLELKIGSILEKNKWGYSIGNIYEDFETGKYRESDIAADKTVNGIAISLFVECKKSTDKQIVLYAPKNNKLLSFISIWLKLFPRIRFGKDIPYSEKKIFEEFSKLPCFGKDIPFAKNLIVTKGDTVTQDNVNYLSSINGLIKKSVHNGSDGYLETNFRCLYLYILVFDGQLFQLSNSKTEDFDLKEITYGQYEYQHHFQFASHHHEDINNDLVTTANQFGSKFIIEVMTPEHFEKYIQNIEATISKVNVKNLEGWGEGWYDIKATKTK